jgi:hypothetical protein
MDGLNSRAIKFSEDSTARINKLLGPGVRREDDVWDDCTDLFLPKSVTPLKNRAQKHSAKQRVDIALLGFLDSDLTSHSAVKNRREDDSNSSPLPAGEGLGERVKLCMRELAPGVFIPSPGAAHRPLNAALPAVAVREGNVRRKDDVVSSFISARLHFVQLRESAIRL